MADPLQVDRLISSIVTDDVRRAGGAQLTDALRRLVQKVEAQERASTRLAGYKEGYKKGVKEGRGTGVKAEASSPRPLFCSISSQTDTDPPHPTSAPPIDPSVSLSPDPTLPALPPTSRRDTSEPRTELFPHSPPARDFSSLRTGIPQPFGSLCRRFRRSRRPPRPSSRAHEAGQPIFILKNYSVHSKCPSHSGIAPASCPTLHDHPLRTSSSTFDASVRLDWDRDPRLRGLSRALTALGWSRPG
ncbi:hypothetical protein B0H15DRAFT_861720 [Mycena belliarum]|uniref:Uncharacterized protein n=1 Tax=Mycena belliarum TaxID=1033014 RepID=A0AAD6TU37_9AGAR|nr:hypothetical protein B0H15DRAFT_861720 [Mycena belliae]